MCAGENKLCIALGYLMDIPPPHLIKVRKSAQSKYLQEQHVASGQPLSHSSSPLSSSATCKAAKKNAFCNHCPPKSHSLQTLSMPPVPKMLKLMAATAEESDGRRQKILLPESVPTFVAWASKQLYLNLVSWLNFSWIVKWVSSGFSPWGSEPPVTNQGKLLLAGLLHWIH